MFKILFFLHCLFNVVTSNKTMERVFEKLIECENQLTYLNDLYKVSINMSQNGKNWLEEKELIIKKNEQDLWLKDMLIIGVNSKLAKMEALYAQSLTSLNDKSIHLENLLKNKTEKIIQLEEKLMIQEGIIKSLESSVELLETEKEKLQQIVKRKKKNLLNLRHKKVSNPDEKNINDDDDNNNSNSDNNDDDGDQNKNTRDIHNRNQWNAWLQSARSSTTTPAAPRYNYSPYYRSE